ncbi:MAG: hypothetical protein AAGG08_04510 [Actinomycetota bacterium]
MPGYGTIDEQYATRLATTPAEDDGPVWMINLMSYKEVAEYADGRETTLTGRQADDAYAPIGPLSAVGAAPVFVGDVADQFLGASPTWDRVAVVRYPTRAAFIAMQQRDDFQQAHVHKDAGMAETIVMGGQPIESPGLDDAPDWSEVPHPPTDEDGQYTMIHVIRFHDQADGEVTPDHMEAYQQVAGSVAVPHGVRIDGWFKVEGTIVGDGRAWHQVRFNTFPSRAAFLAVMTDPDRLAAQADHRETAIADTYTIGVRGFINRLAASLDD